jgi:hypothetical protein
MGVAMGVTRSEQSIAAELNFVNIYINNIKQCVTFLTLSSARRDDLAIQHNGPCAATDGRETMRGAPAILTGRPASITLGKLPPDRAG